MQRALADAAWAGENSNEVSDSTIVILRVVFPLSFAVLLLVFLERYKELLPNAFFSSVHQL